MKRFKRILVYFLSVAVAVSLMPASAAGETKAANFEDITGDTTIEKKLGVSWPGDEKLFKITPQGTAAKSDVSMWIISKNYDFDVYEVDSSGSRGDAIYLNGSETNPLYSVTLNKGESLYIGISATSAREFKLGVKITGYSEKDGDGAITIVDNTSCGSVGNYETMATMETKGIAGAFKYTLTAEEPAVYRVASSDGYVYVSSDNPSYDKRTISSGDGNKMEFTLNKDESITFSLTGKAGTNHKLVVERKAYNCIKEINIGKDITAAVGSSKTINADFTWYDSGKSKEYSVIQQTRVRKWNSEGELVDATIHDVSFEKVDENNLKIEAYTVGIYQLQVVTTQNVSATILLTVTPAKPNVSGYKATGKKTSSTISIYYTQKDIDGYEVYLKTSSGYKLKGKTKKSGSYHKYTVTGLKANKVYTVKVRTYKKVNSKNGTTTVSSPYSKEFKIVTAPTAAPKIKSLSPVKTTYYKATSKWISAYWDAGGVFHPGYYLKSSAHSVAVVKVKNSKVSGASYYQSNWGEVSKGTISKSFSGKVKAGSKTVKVRAVKKAGNAVAYGPWSKSMSVKIKSAK